jgi:hypothetical protein
MKDIYELDLHENVIINRCESVTRVPGGWIYMWLHPDGISVTSTFVPWTPEFNKADQPEPF